MHKIYLSAFFVFIFAFNLAAQTRNLQIVDPKRESPKATVATFLQAFKEPRVGVTPDPIEEAIKCIDLAGIPPEYRQVKGLEIASQLVEIIESVENFNIGDVPDTPSGETYSLFQSQIGEIRISKQINGEWLFTNETIRSVPLLLVAVEEQRRAYGSATLTQSESVGSQIRERMPAAFKQRTLGLERWQWIGLLALVFLGAVAAQIFKLFISLVFGRRLTKYFKALSEDDLGLLYPPVRLLAFAVFFRLGLSALSLTQASFSYLKTAIFLVNAIAIIWLLYRIVEVVSKKMLMRAEKTDSQVDDLLIPFVSIIIRILIFISGFIVVAENLDFNVTGIIAGLGIGGIAIALASQETLSNFFATMVLLIERPFLSDDKISVGDVEGTVKRIGLRSTKIERHDRSIVTIPNSTLVKENIVNDGLLRYRSWTLNLNISCKNGMDKIEEFKAELENIIKTSEFFLNTIYSLGIHDLTYPSLVLKVEVNFKESGLDFELEAREDLITKIVRLAEKMEIVMEPAK